MSFKHKIGRKKKSRSGYLTKFIKNNLYTCNFISNSIILTRGLKQKKERKKIGIRHWRRRADRKRGRGNWSRSRCARDIVLNRGGFSSRIGGEEEI